MNVLLHIYIEMKHGSTQQVLKANLISKHDTEIIPVALLVASIFEVVCTVTTILLLRASLSSVTTHTSTPSGSFSKTVVFEGVILKVGTVCAWVREHYARIFIHVSAVYSHAKIIIYTQKIIELLYIRL